MKRSISYGIIFLLLPTFLLGSQVDDDLLLMKRYNPDMRLVPSSIHINKPALITNLIEKAGGDGVVTQAKNFIEKYRGLFSINGDISYKHDRVIGGRDVKTVRFIYTYKGYPIYPSGLAVSIDNKGYVRKVTFFKLSLSDLTTDASFNREDAYYLVVNKYADFRNVIGSRYTEDSVREVVLLMGNKAFFAYEVRVASFASLTNVSYFIDAKSGKLLFKKNNVVYLNKAKVYNPNPGVDGKNPLVEVDIVDLDPNVSDKTLTGTLIRSMNCYGKGEEREFSIPQYQATIRFYVCNIAPKAVSDENGDFYFTPDDPTKCFNPEDSQLCFESVMEDDFAEVMMYYHADKMYAYFKGMGFDKIITNSGLPSLMTVVNFKLPNFYELRFNCEEDPDNPGWRICSTDKYMPFDNAAFIPYDGSFDDFNIKDDAIVFGQGEKVDFAYDAEVTYHEFTHAVIGSTSNLAYAYFDQYGLYIDPGAMNEGLADYFSSTVSGDPYLGEYVSNATEYSGALRDLTVSVRCPDDLWGESHNDGLLLSTALWRIREEFIKKFGSEDLFDQKVYETVVSLSQIATFSEFSNGLIGALKGDPNIGEEFANTAEAILKENNIVECERVADLKNGKYLMLVEGGDMVQLSPYVPGYLQFYYDMPENVAKFMIDMDIYSNSMMGGSDAEIRILMKKDNPVEFDISFSGDVTSNADFEITTPNNSHFEVSAPQIEGGHRYYIAFVNYGGAEGILQMINPSVIVKEPELDAGFDTTEDVVSEDIVVVADAEQDAVVMPDVVEDVSEDAISDVVDASIADVSLRDVVTTDTGTALDVVVIDGSVNQKEDSGCSCALVE